MRGIPKTAAFLLALSATASADESWRHYGGDAGGQRYTPHTQIRAANLDGLRTAWTYRTGDLAGGEDGRGRSSFKATPVLHDGTLYLSTPFNRIVALDAATGRERWTFDPQVDFSRRYAEMYTSRGVSLWIDAEASGTCAERVIIGTLDARLLAVDADDGRPCAAFGKGGSVDLSAGIDNFRPGEYSVTSPPSVTGDVIVVGSSVGDNGAVELDHGDVRGFDARSGDLLWRWDPIPRKPSDAGADSWIGSGAVLTGAANAWSVISADPDRGLVYLPTTSPSPDFFGGERPGDNLFANSVVALDAASGERVWHFQTVHHDLWDYDLAAQPTLTTIRIDGQARDVVLQATKTGHLFVLDRESGRPMAPVEERPVPATDVPGERASPTQPLPVSPPPLGSPALGEADIWEFSREHGAWCGAKFSSYRYEGLFTPPSLGGTVVFPGNPGGVNWGGVAVSPDLALAVAVYRRWPTVVTLIPRADFERERHAAADDPLQPEFTAQAGTPYGMKRHHFVNPANGLPCIRGPWSELVAIDLTGLRIAWRTPIGSFDRLADHPRAASWGSLTYGGPIITASGLVFAATDEPPALQAYDADSGRLLRSLPLPAGAQATPMSYVVGRRQFVVIAAGGSEPATGKPGDYVVAFSLETPTVDGQ